MFEIKRSARSMAMIPAAATAIVALVASISFLSVFLRNDGAVDLEKHRDVIIPDTAVPTTIALDEGIPGIVRSTGVGTKCLLGKNAAEHRVNMWKRRCCQLKMSRPGRSDALQINIHELIKHKLDEVRMKLENEQDVKKMFELVDHIGQLEKADDACQKLNCEAVIEYRKNSAKDWRIIGIRRRSGQQLRLCDYLNAVVPLNSIQEKRIDILSSLQCAGVVNTLLCKRTNVTCSSPETSRHGDFGDGNGNTVNGSNNIGEDGGEYWIASRSPAYKAINHFRELLNRIQGRSLGTNSGSAALDKSRIPSDNLEAIELEIAKRHLVEPTLQQIRECMRVTGNNRYYGELYSIWARCTSGKLPQFTWQQEQKLCTMFNMVQNAYAKCKPKGRKNFLSYTYTLFKLCELLEYDALLPLISLLKSDEKLRVHDSVWKDVCGSLHWQFIATVRNQ